MIFKKKDHLSIIAIDDTEKYEISFEQLGTLLIEKPSNMIYCTLYGKLYGIISMGDIHRARIEERNSVCINTSFTYLRGYKYMRARKIFLENEKINALPIVDDENFLIGDYTRWDDAFSGYEFGFLRDTKYADKVWKKYKEIAIVKPSGEYNIKERLVSKWIQFFDSIGLNYEIINMKDIIKAFENKDIVLFTDKDEKRGLGTLFKDIFGKNFVWEKAKTLEEMGELTEKEIRNEIEAEVFEDVIRDYKQQGVNIITLQMNSCDDPYFKKIELELQTKFDTIGAKREARIIHTELWKDFYDDFYDKDMAYVVDVGTQTYPQIFTDGIIKLKDNKSKYYNVINGERVTIGQPKKYNKTIYFFGPCLIVGWRAGDAYTIESKLQALLNENGIYAKVVNCGSWTDEFQLLLRICSTKIKKGDIAVVFDKRKGFEGIPTVNLANILVKENISSNWFWDDMIHANHKVLGLWAEEIYKFIRNYDFNQTGSELAEKKNAEFKIMAEPYIRRYFANDNYNGVIAAIVMNCNPFTYGHRYLIEEACKRVDCLVIFVVEENKSLFSFKERFAMVVNGTKDLKNVKVIPSGDFILSQKTFPEYFAKVEDKDVIRNAEFDISIFAKGIAPKLGIKYRFVGEEKNDAVTAEYNKAMKKILSQNDIETIEIPRKTIMDGKPIAATRVRELLEENNYKEVKRLVPQTTFDIMMQPWE